MFVIDTDAYILDACCGGRQFWFDKKHAGTVYCDIRTVAAGSISVQPNWACVPDVIADFKQLPFESETFNLVVFDIPHKLKHDSELICQKYGSLGVNWRWDIKQGFDECMRTLKARGVLILKYNDLDIRITEMLKVIDYSPLFGTRSKKGVNSTYWLCFMKEAFE